MSPDKRSGFSRGSLPSSGMTLSQNLAYKVSNVPAGTMEADPQLALTGGKPTAYYHPAGASSPVVDAGVDVGLPFEGRAPDIGAYEWVHPPVASPVLYMLATTSSTVSLTWTAPRTGDNVLTHELYQDGKLVATLTGTQTSHRVTGLLPATKYTFEVWAVSGTTGKSDVLTVTTARVSAIEEVTASTLSPGVHHSGFSPNGDGVNDAFVLPVPDRGSVLALRVYDRRGAEVYRSEAYDNDWGGEVSGQPLAAGTYFYRAAVGGENLYWGYVEIQY